jgi:hypothetical protein
MKGFPGIQDCLAWKKMLEKVFFIAQTPVKQLQQVVSRKHDCINLPETEQLSSGMHVPDPCPLAMHHVAHQPIQQKKRSIPISFIYLLPDPLRGLGENNDENT